MTIAIKISGSAIIKRKTSADVNFLRIAPRFLGTHESEHDGYHIRHRGR